MSKTEKLEKVYMKFPRVVGVALMLVLPFVAVRYAWRESKDDIIEAYQYLWYGIVTGKPLL